VNETARELEEKSKLQQQQDFLSRSEQISERSVKPKDIKSSFASALGSIFKKEAAKQAFAPQPGIPM